MSILPTTEAAVTPYIGTVIKSWGFKPTPTFNLTLTKHTEFAAIITRLDVSWRGHYLDGSRIISMLEARSAVDMQTYIAQRLDLLLDDLRLALDMLS